MEVVDPVDAVGPMDSMDSIVAVETTEAVAADRLVENLEEGICAVLGGVTISKTRAT